MAVIFALSLVLLVMQFARRGSRARNPFRMLRTCFRPRHALGTQSFAATTP